MEMKINMESRLREFVNNFNFALLCYEKSYSELSYTNQFRTLQRKVGMEIKGLKQSRTMATLLNHAAKFKKLNKEFPFSYGLNNLNRHDKIEELKKDTIKKLSNIISE
jgi:hypothetical protein